MRKIEIAVFALAIAMVVIAYGVVGIKVFYR